MILGMSQASENSIRHRPRGGSLLVTHTAPAMPTPFCERVLRPERSTEESAQTPPSSPRIPKTGARPIHYQASHPALKTGTISFPTTALLDPPITSGGVQLSILK